MASFGNDEMTPHFVYAGSYYNSDRDEHFKEMFLTAMKKNKIKSSMLTMLFMMRWEVVTEEKAKEAWDGKLKNDKTWGEISVHDDLEIFYTNILNSKEIKGEVVHSYFTPKLTEEEMKLVENQDEDYLSSFRQSYYTYQEELEESDSNSKYVHGQCVRWTFTLERKKKKKMAVKNCCNII